MIYFEYATEYHTFTSVLWLKLLLVLKLHVTKHDMMKYTTVCVCVCQGEGITFGISQMCNLITLSFCLMCVNNSFLVVEYSTAAV